MTGLSADIPNGFMSGPEFGKHLVPLAAALASIVTAARADRPESGLPAADSIAMREWIAQPMFDADADQGPPEGVIDVARILTEQRLFAGEDHILAVRTLMLDETESFVWSVPVLGRAALESFAHVDHLAEADIPSRLRWGRTMNELIYSAKNITRLPAQAQPKNWDPMRRRDQATAMNLTRVKDNQGNNTSWFEEVRPGYLDLVAASFGDSELGSTIYNFWSGIAHAASWGLSQSHGEVELAPSGIGVRALIVSSLQTLTTTGLLLVLAHNEAVHRQARWCGWTLPTYAAAFADHKTVFQQFLTEAGAMAEEVPEQAVRMRDLLWTP